MGQEEKLIETVPVKSMVEGPRFDDDDTFVEEVRGRKQPAAAVRDAQSRLKASMGGGAWVRHECVRADQFAAALPADEPILSHSVADIGHQVAGYILTPKALYFVSEKNNYEPAGVKRLELVGGQADAVRDDVSLLARYARQAGRSVTLVTPGHEVAPE